ncbi:MAG TPA: 2-C-methyl-D-erythritol 4-phosphate cytidylyltransferase [Pyrinomonadaceae bacterium]|nr:2-C-methyl-D-erythritol 4-phosphate cytidylyltransferase [Pyrinomonadaceae bacterium]
MNVAIIVAAGQGSRMGGEGAKQFLELAGIPIIIHAIRAFDECESIHEIVVVLPASESANFLASAARFGLRKLSRVVPGGATRSESVWRGLQSLRSATVEVVAVHDGVRPLVSADEIARTVSAAQQNDAAVLVAPVTDTIKEIKDDRIVSTLERSRLRRALTPQCFRYSLLSRAYAQADISDQSLTDESVLMERLGISVTAVEGSPRNIKITTPEDLIVAEALLRCSS